MRIHSLIPMALLLVLPRVAAAESAVEELATYIESGRCPVATSKPAQRWKNCLVRVTSYACASGCPRAGYNVTADALDPELLNRVSPHASLKYLRLLRNAAFASPDVVLPGTLSFGLPLKSLLYQQVQMYLHNPLTLYYDAQGAPLDRSGLLTGNHTVDPSRFFMVALANEARRAQAMTQGDLGGWLFSLATSFAAAGDAGSAGYYLGLSEKVFNSFAVRHADGGVRNNKRSNRCWNNQYCYWFHSFLVGDPVEPQTVLNQHLHAIRDALGAHAALAAWRDDAAAGVPLPPGFTQHIRNLRDYARGGLNQLAYGQGNESFPDAPPNLEEFLQNSQNDPQLPGVKRYNAYYRYVMGSGPKNGSTEGNVCHYNFHNLELMMSILTTIRTNPYYKKDPDFIALYYKLLYGRESGDTRSCNNSSVPRSKKMLRGLPLPELYYGGKVYTSFPNQSSFPFGHCSEALWFKYPVWFPNVSEAQSMRETRAFFDQAYAGCTF